MSWNTTSRDRLILNSNILNLKFSHPVFDYNTAFSFTASESWWNVNDLLQCNARRKRSVITYRVRRQTAASGEVSFAFERTPGKHDIKITYQCSWSNWCIKATACLTRGRPLRHSFFLTTPNQEYVNNIFIKFVIFGLLHFVFLNFSQATPLHKNKLVLFQPAP